MTNVTITLDEALLERAKAKARQECRSLSQQVSFLILQDAAAATPKKGLNLRKGAKV